MTFSRLIWDERIEQYKAAKQIHKPKNNVIFYDRGLADVTAYLKHEGSPEKQLEKKLISYPYELVFLLKPLEKFYVQDSDRMESFEEAISLHHEIESAYKAYSNCINVPFDTPEKRIEFILNQCDVSIK